MKKKKTKSAKSAKRFPRLPLMIFTAVVVLAIAAITVMSRQSASGKQSVATENAPTATAGPRYTTVKIAGQDVQVDSQTGKIKPLTADEAKQLAEGLKGMLNKSTEGIVPEHDADGSTSLDLQGRFQNVTVARVNEDGTVTQSCVDNPRAAANFFGIDPKLIEPETPVAKGGQ